LRGFALASRGITARRDIKNGTIGNATIENATIGRRNFGIADCVMASPPTCRLERQALAASARTDGTFSQLVEFDTARVISIRSVCTSGKSRKIAPADFTSGSSSAPDRRPGSGDTLTIDCDLGDLQP
jgi:hypothetical protein